MHARGLLDHYDINRILFVVSKLVFMASTVICTSSSELENMRWPSSNGALGGISETPFPPARWRAAYLAPALAAALWLKCRPHCRAQKGKIALKLFAGSSHSSSAAARDEGLGLLDLRRCC